MFSRIAEALARGETVLLATIVAVEGSAPGAEGSRLARFADGSRVGTVGGGALEADVVARLERGERGIVAYPLGESDLEPGMLCGGTVKVRLQRLDRGAAPAFHAVAESLGRGETATLVLGEAVETVRPVPRVIAIGAGHVGEATLGVARAAGLRSAVADDRPGLAASERFAGADPRLELAPRAAISRLSLTPADAVLVSMRTAELDFEAVAAAAASPAFYVGLIGSRRKWDALAPRVSEGGGRVRCPAGLALGGRSPGAIAVAVVAEILSVWHEAHLERRGEHR